MSEVDQSVDVPDNASKMNTQKFHSKQISQDFSVQQQQSVFKSQEDNPKAKRNYMIYLREITSKEIEQNDQMRFLLYYTLEDKPQIETKLKTIIEVPFERNEALESIEFKLQVVYKEQEEQIICTQKIYLYQLGLTEKEGNTSGTYKIRFKADNPELPEYEFAMIFDASVVKTSMEGASIDEGEGEGCVQIFTANIKKKYGFDKFEKKRKREQEDNFIQNTGNISLRYRVDLKLLSQSYQIWLDDPEIDDVFFFYTTKDIEDIKKAPFLNITFKEIVNETIELEDYGNEGGVITKNTEIENNVIGEPSKQDIMEIFQQKPGQEPLSEVLFNYPIQDNFSIDFKFTLIENSSFHKKFLGFTAVKVLETRLFTTEFEPSYAEINLNSMDDDLPDQTWRLKCFESYARNTDTLTTWDHMHNTIIKKNFRLAQENEDVIMENDFLSNLFQKEYNANSILEPLKIAQEDDFQILLKNYTYINEYEKILQDKNERRNLEFSQMQNHTFFKTVSPFDYITFKLYSGDKMIGYYEESFFKIPENQLVLGYLIKAKDGRIKSKFLEEGEVGGDMDDDDEDMIIGTIKIVMDHIGYNDKILKNDNWIYDLENINTDDDQLVKIIKSGIQNFPVTHNKRYVFRLALDQIWNFVDFVVPCIKDKAFELKIRMSNFCYVIRFTVEQIKARDFKDMEILKMFKLEKKCHIERTEENLIFYCKSNDTVYKISTDLTTSQSLVFQLTSYMDYMIFELKSFPEHQTIAFQTQQIRQCYFFSSHGFLLIPMKIPKKLPQIKKETVYELAKQNSDDEDSQNSENEDDFDKQQKIPDLNKKQNYNNKQLFNSVCYFKFFFEFITTEEKDGEEDDILNTKGIYSVGLFQPSILTTRQQEKKLKNFIYELYIYDLDNFKKQKQISQRITFNSKLIKYSTEQIEGAEFFRDGSNDANEKSLRLHFVLKRVFSDDPDEDDGDAPIVWEKKAYYNMKDFYLDKDVMGEENRDLKPLNIELKPNSFSYVPIKFWEDNVNLNIELFLCINYRHNRFIEIPKSKIYFTITQDMKQEMQVSRVIERSTTLKFKITSLSKDAKNDKKQKQSDWISCQDSKKKQSSVQEIMFQGYHIQDTLMIEIDNGTPMSETAIVKLNNLIQMPIRKSLGKITPDEEVIELDEQQQELEEKYDWCFINLNNRKLQFLIRFMSNENWDALQGEKSMAQSKGTISDQKSEKKSTQNASKISGKTQISKVSSIKQITEPEVQRLKKEIQRVKSLIQERMTIITKEKKELIKKQKWIEELNNIIQRARLQDDPNFNKKKKSEAMSKGVSSSGEKKIKKKVELSEEAKQAKKLYQEQCVCAGDQEDSGNNKLSYIPVPGGFGFCAQCIKQIKEEYEKELESFQTEANQYEETYLGNFNMENKIMKMKNKIVQFQKKSAGIEVEEDNIEEKMMIDEINYIKKSIKIIDSECIMLKKDHERQVKEKQLLQADIEQKITQKDLKIDQLQHDCEVKQEHVDKLKEKIAQKSNELSKLKEQSN